MEAETTLPTGSVFLVLRFVFFYRLCFLLSSEVAMAIWPPSCMFMGWPQRPWAKSHCSPGRQAREPGLRRLRNRKRMREKERRKEDVIADQSRAALSLIIARREKECEKGRRREGVKQFLSLLYL